MPFQKGGLKKVVLKSSIFEHNKLKVLEENAIIFIYITIFCFQAFNGAFKYLFSTIGVFYLYYTPVFLSLLYLGLSVFNNLLRQRFSISFFIIVSFLGGGTLVGLLYIDSIPQILFGNYMFLFLLFGVKTFN